MAPWAIWLVVAGVLAIAEVLTLTFVLGMLAGGAVAAAVIAALSGPAVLQGIGFVVVSGGLLVTVMPMARRHRHLPPLLRTGSAALVGSRGTAITQIDRHSGLVRLGGENWTARPYDDDVVIPAGAEVDVYAIDGATAVIHPANPS
ncbi:MAG TPA: NfeD family protein [Mycobacteriales bacterium]|jgi:membrane protein implicated in regulation of membrane protease activity|nr:NfeD family protein [Mycobacteriales bacterium]